MLVLTGDLDVHAAPELSARLRELAGAGVVDLVVDTTGVAFMDSAGIGVLLRAFKDARRLRRAIRFVITDAVTVSVLARMGLTALLPVHASLEELTDHRRAHDGTASR